MEYKLQAKVGHEEALSDCEGEKFWELRGKDAGHQQNQYGETDSPRFISETL